MPPQPSILFLVLLITVISSTTDSRSKRQLSRNNNSKWTNHTIPYYFNTTDPTYWPLVKLSMAQISSQTCIKFIEDLDPVPKKRLQIVNEGRCSSFVGMAEDDQKLWLTGGCRMVGGATHELLHSLGMTHIHMRYDRDSYVNLTGSADNANLNLQSYDQVYMPVPYEYGSCLHYNNGVVSKQKEFLRTTGSRKQGTFYDMASVNWHYDCSCPEKLDCAYGGYSNPANCSECVCPLGYSGALCTDHPENSTVIQATLDWQNFTMEFEAPGLETYEFHKSFIIITAPSDKTIQVKILEMINFNCDNGCNYYSAVEIKYMGDPRISNPVHCCPEEDVQKVLTSKLNPTPIILYQRKGKSQVTIGYRFLDTPLSNLAKGTNGYDCYQYYQ